MKRKRMTPRSGRRTNARRRSGRRRPPSSERWSPAAARAYVSGTSTPREAAPAHVRPARPLGRAPAAQLDALDFTGAPCQHGHEVASEIVGRDDEVAALHAFVAGRARRCRGPAAIVLEGEAGIGKSTLWLAGVDAARRARAARAHRAARGGRAGTRPRGARRPARRMPPPRCCRSSRRRAGGRSRRRSCSTADDGRAADPRALAVAVHDALLALAERGALVIAIDDVQWLDPASANALVVRAAAARPRADHDPPRPPRRRPAALERALPGDVERLSVGPLSLGAIQGLVRDRLGLGFPRPDDAAAARCLGRQSVLRARAGAGARHGGAPRSRAAAARARLARAPRRRAAPRAARGDEDGAARRGCHRRARARARRRGRNRRADARSGRRCARGRASRTARSGSSIRCSRRR